MIEFIFWMIYVGGALGVYMEMEKQDRFPWWQRVLCSIFWPGLFTGVAAMEWVSKPTNKP